jgi:signal transduction histidine kinase
MNESVELAAREAELKRAEESLGRLATFPEQNPNPVVETDLGGKVTYLNPAAQERFPDLSTAGLAHPVLDGLESIIRSLEESEEESYVRELEVGGYIYEQKTTYMGSNNIVRIYAHNITELKRLQKQLQDSLTELEKTNRELQETQVQLVQSEKMAAMANMVAGIAHEINTPIGAMSSVHDTLIRAANKLKILLEQSIPDDSQSRGRADAILRVIADGANVIKSGSERVSTVMQSLKNFARLDEAELNKVDIHSGLDDTLRLVQHDLGDRIEVIKKYGEVPPIVCYPGRLNQVFLCFLVNVIEAIEGTGKITLTTAKEGENLHVTVQDTGIGIPDGDFEKIFEPGFTTKGVGVGSGLGLSICYQIMRDHNGEILVHSKPGEGAAFTAVLLL